MKSPEEIFSVIGVPIAHSSRDYGPNNYTGFRAFNEHDIAAIQAEAFKAGVEHAARVVGRVDPVGFSERYGEPNKLP